MDSSPLDTPLVYVTGKGGVGKSTVAAALGLAAAARERTTLVCEVTDPDRDARGSGRGGGAAAGEVQRGEALWTLSINPQDALEEWLGRQLSSPTLVRTLARSQAFQYFIAAAPGARELITIGKIWDIAQGAAGGREQRIYDTLVVDAAASGHGIAMLRTPQTFGEIARVGPVRGQAQKIRAWLEDPARTAYVGVALPAELPVNETLELEASLRAAVGQPLAAVIVNDVLPDSFSDEDADALQAALATAPGPAQRAALTAALSEHERARAQRTQIARLAAATPAPLVLLPHVPPAAEDGEARLRARLADELARVWPAR